MKLRLGIIGCGRATTMFHLKAVEEVEGIEVVAVADRDPN
ncbi:gfo/Idh/MocA family oxidoreductase, partial [Candidatus Bathyarchaeota archaeon]